MTNHGIPTPHLFLAGDIKQAVKNGEPLGAILDRYSNVLDDDSLNAITEIWMIYNFEGAFNAIK